MTKERLRAYRSLMQERDQIRQMIEEIEATLYAPKIPKLSAVPGGGQKVGGVTPTDAKIDKRDELLALYTEKCDRMTEELLAIERAIDGLETREKTLLRLHYIQGLTWELVCVEMNYSWRQVHRIHAKALEKLKEA